MSETDHFDRFVVGILLLVIGICVAALIGFVGVVVVTVVQEVGLLPVIGIGLGISNVFAVAYGIGWVINEDIHHDVLARIRGWIDG